MTAKPGAHQLGPAAVRMQGFNGLGERDSPVVGNRRALIGLVQAGAIRRIGGQSLTGKNGRPGEAEHEDGGEQSEDRHGRGLAHDPVKWEPVFG